MKLLYFLIISTFSITIDKSHSANILGLFPHPGKSHFDVFEVLMVELANRGHNVTVVSFFPQKTPLQNYTDIDLRGSMPIFLNIVSFETFEKMSSWSAPFWNIYVLSDMSYQTCQNVLPSEQIQNLIRTEVKFDLIITESFNTNCFLSVVYKLQTPFIALSSCDLLPWANYPFRNPRDPSYIPNIFNGVSSEMTLSERYYNAILNVASDAFFYLWYQRPAQKLVSQYIGKDVPPLQTIAHNTSLLLVNTHFTLHHPKPHVPAVIEVGGLHIKPSTPLPEDIKSFMDSASDGVIVFSLGSMLKTGTIDQPRIEAFVNVFSKLPYKVIWKFDGKIENCPNNTMILPWLPQRDILCHPNVRGFIGHGGLLGLTEAVYCGVPVVGIPMFGDQLHNLKHAETLGVAVVLKYKEITENNVQQRLNQILEKRFQLQAKEISRRFHDRPSSPLDTSVYWVEYAIRHHGAPHLKTAATKLAWFQYYMLDVLVMFVGTIVLSMYVSVPFRNKLTGMDK